MRTGVIYKATNLINGNFYIGRDINWPKRKNGHLSNAFNELTKDYNIYFHNSIRAYGKDNFKWEVLYNNVPEDKLDVAEICAIYTFEPQYNLTEGGEGSLGRKLSEDTKKNISKSLLGKHVSPQTEFKKGYGGFSGHLNPMFGKRVSEERKNKISISLKSISKNRKRDLKGHFIKEVQN